MASPSAMAKCLRADAALMVAGDETLLERAGALAVNLVATTNEAVERAGSSTTFATMVLMIAAATALEADDESR